MKFDLDDHDESVQSSEVPRWLLSYADMITLLLAFFVALVSYANTDLEAFKDLLASMRDAFGADKTGDGYLQKRDSNKADPIEVRNTLKVPLTSREQDALKIVKQFVLQKRLNREVEVITADDGITVRLKDRLVFDVGSDRINQSILPVLDRLAALAHAFPEGLSIEGHTDNTPIHTDRFPSNWELSVARAAAVLRYVQRDHPLPSKNIRVVGLADNMPLAPNTNDENRARNRRVEFVFKRNPKIERRSSAR
jgi:chemotaxis protein MotB